MVVLKNIVGSIHTNLHFFGLSKTEQQIEYRILAVVRTYSCVMGKAELSLLCSLP